MSSCNDNDYDDDDVIAVTLDQLFPVFPKPLYSSLSTHFPPPFPFLQTHMLHANWLKLLLDTRLVAFSPSIFKFPSSP